MREVDWIGERGLGRLVRRIHGPEPAVVRGCELRVTSVSIYEAGFTVEWLLTPAPDLSDISVEVNEDVVLSAQPEQRAELRNVLLETARMRALVGEPTVAVDQHSIPGSFVSCLIGGAAAGWEGQVKVRSLPPEARVAVVHIAGAVLSIPLAD
jgi:hypothetical protein